MKSSIENQIKSLDLKQNAIKILINSFYGAFGNRYFYFHNNDISFMMLIFASVEIVLICLNVIHFSSANKRINVGCDICSLLLIVVFVLYVSSNTSCSFVLGCHPLPFSFILFSASFWEYNC